MFKLEVKIYIPHHAIQDYVLNISTVEVVLQKGIKDVITPYPPTPLQTFIFYCNHPISMGKVEKEHFDKQPESVIIGPQYSRVNIKIHNRLRAIRVDFLPGGMYRLLGTPMHELFDSGLDASDVFGSEMNRVNQQLLEIDNLEEGKNIVEKFLLNKITRLKEILPFDSAMRILMNNDGNMSIEKTAKISCLSLKQFERKCKERIGKNPKLYARILKFSKAYRLHEAFPQVSWT